MHSTLYPIEEPFRLRPHGNHIEVVAGSRASIEVEVERHPSFDDPIEIQAIGFPPHVVGIVAITKDPSRILLVVEASDLAAPTESHPFTLEGHSNGVRWSQRLFVTIAPEQPPPKEDW
ncbi:MAG: hypothetical protein N2515_07350 [Deltaproteobacteria bacterium]|nr:hypothetical protein [Deltaproteobacteria bacterium]MDW8245025.1 hypothetical protein [Sandaracinaceae bacterium]